MKTEKIVYTPEVVYQPNYEKRTKNTNIINNNQKAALITATLLALSASGQTKVNTDTNALNTTQNNRDKVILVLNSQKTDNKFKISENISKREQQTPKKQNDTNLSAFAALLTIAGLGLTVGSLLNINELLRKRNTELQKENDYLKSKLKLTQTEYEDFRIAHPEIGVMTTKRLKRMKERVLKHDFSCGDEYGRN